MSASGQYAIICPSNNNISTPGIVYISSTYGQTWTATSLSVNGAVAVSASGQIMAVCNNSNGASSSSLNGIFISTNYGRTWSRTYSATSIYQITMSASGQYQYATFYSGSGDSNYFSTNYGQSWSLMQGLGASLSNTIQGITCSASGQYVIATNGVAFYYSSNYGQTWFAAAGSSGGSYNQISASASGQYIVAGGWGSSNLVYYSTNYGANWTSLNVGITMTTVAISANGEYITGTIGGGLGGSPTGSIYTSITRRPPQLITAQSTATTTGLSILAPNIATTTNIGIVLGRTVTSNNYATMGFQYVGAGSTSNYLYLGANVANTLCITATGNVGIGLTNPGALFQIISSSTSQFAQTTAIIGEAYALSASTKNAYSVAGTVVSYYTTNLLANAGLLFDIAPQNASGVTNVYFGGVAGGTANGPANFVIGRRSAATSWAESLRIDTTGQVGIGITNPGYSLDVSNQTTLNTSANISIRGYSTVAGSGPGINWFAFNNAITPQGRIEVIDNTNFGGNMIFSCKAAASGSAPLVEYMRILGASGFVGIGTASPPHTLSAFSNIAVPTITTAAIWPCQLSVIGQVGGQMQLKLGSYYTGGVGSYCAIQATETYSGAEHPQSLIIQPLGGQVGIGSTSIPVACPLYVYSNTNSGWDGRGYFGNATLGFVCGTYNGTVLIGGHNSILTGWTDITIGAVGTTTSIPGSVVSGTVNGLTLYRDAARLNLSVGVAVNTTNTGNTNIIFGYEVGQNITTGTQNVLMGVVGTGGKITTGNHNTCIGYQAGFGITNGGLNTCIGHQALGNTSGTDLSGNYNGGFGHYTLVNLTTGSFNTALGVGAGTGLTSGSYGLYLGTNAQPSAGNNSGEIVICNSGAAVGKGSASCFIQVNQNNMWWSGYTAGGTAIFGAGGQVVASSDRNLKNNITYLTYQGAVQKMLDLKPCTYEFKADKSPTPKVYTGFIAQDVDEVIPTAVDGRKHKFQYEQNADGSPKVDEDGNVKYLKDPEGNLYPRHLGLNTTDILATAVLAIQEQQIVIVDLKTQLVSLKAIVDSLVARQ